MLPGAIFKMLSTKPNKSLKNLTQLEKASFPLSFPLFESVDRT